MTPRISLFGLQLGEKFIINSAGLIWRERDHPDRSRMTDPNLRLQAATGLQINKPADVYALAKFLEEVLRAMSLTFALRFVDVFDEGCNPMMEAQSIFLALRALSDFWDRDDRDDEEDEPEVPETDWDSSIYYEARFQVVAAPQK